MDIVNELKDYGCSVDVADPRASRDEVMREYGIDLVDFNEIKKHHYNAVIVAVAHDDYKHLDEVFFKKLVVDVPNSILADIKGLYRNKISELDYWSL